MFRLTVYTTAHTRPQGSFKRTMHAVGKYEEDTESKKATHPVEREELTVVNPGGSCDIIFLSMPFFEHKAVICGKSIIGFKNILE